MPVAILAIASAAAGACGSGDPFSTGTAHGGSAGKAGESTQPSGGKGGATSGGAATGGGNVEEGGVASDGGEPGTNEPTPTCRLGYGDCNDKPDDGCETPLNTAANCGACENACAEATLPHCAKNGSKYSCTNPVSEISSQRLELPCVTDVVVPELCGSVAEDEAAACNQTTGKIVLKELKVGGEAGAVYDVTLRIRGVVEPKVYQGGIAAGDHFYRGGEPTETNYNSFGMQVTSPPQNFFFNSATSTGERYEVFTLDHTKVIQVAAGATVSLAVSDPDCALVRNCQSFSPTNEVLCTPFVVDGIPPAPVGFAGQFVQIDVVKVARVADP